MNQPAFVKLCRLLALESETEEVFKLCDLLFRSNAYKEIQIIRSIASTENISKYVEYLIELGKGSAGMMAKAELWTLSAENRDIVSLVMVNHPRRLALYMLRFYDNKQIMSILEITCETSAALLYELIQLESIDYPNDRKLIDYLIHKSLKLKSIPQKLLCIIAKLIALGISRITLEDKLGKSIIDATGEDWSKDLRNVNQALSHKESLENTSSFISTIKSQGTIHHRTISGDWINLNDFKLPHKSLCIFSVVWGNREIYLYGLAKSAWPSFSKSAALEELDYSRKILYIHSTIETIEDLKTLINKMNPNIDVILDTRILQSDAKALTMRGWTYIDMLVECAISRSTFIQLTPEWYFGKGMRKLIEKCPDGGIICTPVMRVSEKNFLRFHKDNQNSEGLLELSNKQLAKLVFTEGIAHQYSRLYLNNITPSFTCIPMHNDKGIELYSWAQCTFVCKPNAEYIKLLLESVKPRYSVKLSDNIMQFVDHEGFHKLNELNLAYRVKDTDEFILIEPSRDSGYDPNNEKQIFPITLRRSAYPKHPYAIYLKDI